MVNLFKRKKIYEEKYVPESQKNLSSIQQKNYEQFKEPLKKFCLGKSWKTPLDNIVYIGISDGYLGSIDIGKIMPNKDIHLLCPDIGSLLPEGRLLELLGGALRLKETLDEQKIPYKLDINRGKYIKKVRTHPNSKTSSLATKVLVEEAKKKIRELGKLTGEDHINAQVHPSTYIDSLLEKRIGKCITFGKGKNVFYQIWSSEKTYENKSNHPIGNASVSTRVWEIIRPIQELAGYNIIERND